MDVVIVLLAVLAAFYFILLRPVIDQQRKQRRDISSLEIGDEVLTTAGFYATVVEINTYEDRPMEILLEAAPGVVLRGTTLAIAEIARRADDIDDDDLDDDYEDDDGEDVDALEDVEETAAPPVAEPRAEDGSLARDRDDPLRDRDDDEHRSSSARAG